MKRKAPSEQDLRAFKRVVRHYRNDYPALVQLIKKAVEPQIKAETGPKGPRFNDDFIISIAAALKRRMEALPSEPIGPRRHGELWVRALEWAVDLLWQGERREGRPSRASSPAAHVRRIKERIKKDGRPLEEIDAEIEVERPVGWDEQRGLLRTNFGRSYPLAGWRVDQYGKPHTRRKGPRRRARAATAAHRAARD
jgi:hypothetical protein